MRVLAFVPYPFNTAPGQRYRIEQWAPYLREREIEVSFAAFATPELARILYERGRYTAKARGMAAGLLRRWHEAWSARDHDLVLVHREACLIGPAWVERLAHFNCGRLVFDFDDAIYQPYVSPSNRYLSYLKFPWKTRALCSMATAVLAGNAHLAEYARRYNDRVDIVPSTVSLRMYRPRPARSPGLPVVGWTGSHSSVQYLHSIRGALTRLNRRRPFRLLVVGADDFALPGVQTECRRWRADREVEDLWDMDVGVMPLPDEPWARGKCGMKAIQYMGVGIPAVVSPVGVNREIVEPERTGFHATTEDEWVEALDKLLGDESLRERLGREARSTVEARFSAESQAPRVAEILKGLIE